MPKISRNSLQTYFCSELQSCIYSCLHKVSAQMSKRFLKRYMLKTQPELLLPKPSSPLELMTTTSVEIILIISHPTSNHSRSFVLVLLSEHTLNLTTFHYLTFTTLGRTLTLSLLACYIKLLTSFPASGHHPPFFSPPFRHSVFLTKLKSDHVTHLLIIFQWFLISE